MLALQQDHSSMTFTGNMTSSVLADLEKQPELPVTMDYKVLSRRVYSPGIDSSSDEDIKDLAPEGTPDLSDDERTRNLAAYLLPAFPKQEIENSETLRSCHGPSDSNPVKPKILTSSKRYGDPTKTRSLVNKKLTTYARRQASLSKSEQTNLIKLPYVSRSRDETRSEKKERRQWENAQENGKSPVPKDLELTFAEPHHGGAPVSKSDSFSSPNALSSSGYSTCGSGNGSFSSSTSNASSTAPFVPTVTPSDNVHEDRIDASRTPNDKQYYEGDKAIAELKSIESKPEDIESLGDVFPVESWLDTAEFKNLAITDNPGSNTGLKSTPHVQETNNRANLEGLHMKSSEQTSLNPFKVPKPANEEPICNYSAINSISMVEKVDESNKQRGRASFGSVKLRKSSSRSKMTEAARNSLAFAYQTRDASDALSNSMDSAPDKNDRFAPNSGRRGNYILPKRHSVARIDQSDYVPFATPQSTWRMSSKSNAAALSRRFSERSVTSRDSSDGLSTHSSATDGGSPAKIVESVSSTNLTQRRSSEVQRRSSLRHRLKGAFSFSNLRRAISREKLEEEKAKSISQSYLNENDEDISKVPTKRPQFVSGPGKDYSCSLYKPPSISSMFGSVRVRSKRTREQCFATDRNSMACDPKSYPEYISNLSRRHSFNQKSNDVGIPGHFRPIGRVLHMNVSEGTMMIEMVKPPSGPFGFYVAKSKDNGIVYVSNLSDSYPNKIFAGLMKPGDEILEVNNVSVDQISIDEIYSMILESEKLVLKIKPATAKAT